MWPFSSRTHIDTEKNPVGRSSQAEQNSDPALTQKKRARRRLIGAISVALIAIVVLPLLFDSEPKPMGDEIAIKIPDQDTPFAPQKPAPAPPEAAPPVTEPVLAPAVEPPKVKTEEPVKESVKEPVKEIAKEPVKEIIKEKLKEKPRETPKEAAKITAPTEKEHEAKRAQAALEGKEVAKHSETAASEGKFVVQLGAFATSEKVKSLQDKLTAAGIKSYTQKVQTGQGERTRLRVGPYTDRAEAERMLKKVKAAGLPGTVLLLK